MSFLEDISKASLEVRVGDAVEPRGVVPRTITIINDLQNGLILAAHTGWVYTADVLPVLLKYKSKQAIRDFCDFVASLSFPGPEVRIRIRSWLIENGW
jgi:hypothetical protein